MSEGNLESGEGARIPGTLNDEWRRALGMGHLSVRGLHDGDPERYVKETDQERRKNAL